MGRSERETWRAVKAILGEGRGVNALGRGAGAFVGGIRSPHGICWWTNANARQGPAVAPWFVCQTFHAILQKALCPLIDTMAGDPDHGAILTSGTRSAMSKIMRPRLACPAGIVVDRCHAVSVSRCSAVRSMVSNVFHPRAISIPPHKATHASCSQWSIRCAVTPASLSLRSLRYASRCHHAQWANCRYQPARLRTSFE